MQRRNKVTAVHKANVLRVSDGLYLECVRAVAARHPQVAYEERIIDAMAALLVRDASQFDVVVTTNMYGDILSDEASEIAGSLGLAASLNAGAEHGVAQAQHGSAPDIAGKNVANPASLIGSAAMLLAWLGERRKDANADARRAGDRGRARRGHRRSGFAHARPRRHARHRRVRGEGGGRLFLHPEACAIPWTPRDAQRARIACGRNAQGLSHFEARASRSAPE